MIAIILAMVFQVGLADLQQLWTEIRNTNHYKKMCSGFMENKVGWQSRTSTQQMDALIQLLHFRDPDSIQRLLEKDQAMSFQWSPDGGRLFSGDAGLRNDEYLFHPELRRQIGGSWSIYKEGLKNSLQKAFLALMKSNDGNAFLRFFRTFQENLVVCMDALDRATQSAIATTFALQAVDGFYWDATEDPIVQMNRFMMDVLKPQICADCDSMQCKQDKWLSTKTKLDLWRPLIDKSDGQVSDAQVWGFINEYVIDNDDIGLTEDYKCAFEYTPEQKEQRMHDETHWGQQPSSAASTLALIAVMIVLANF